MFVVSEAEAAAIRTIFQERGELSAMVELRRLFPGITEATQARECASASAAWKPTSVPLSSVRLPFRQEVLVDAYVPCSSCPGSGGLPQRTSWVRTNGVPTLCQH